MFNVLKMYLYMLGKLNLFMVEILNFLDNWQHGLCLIFFKNVPLYAGKIKPVYGGRFFQSPEIPP